MNRDKSPATSAGAGIQLAKQAVHAFADGDEAAAMDMLRTADHDELSWTAGYLLACLRESVSVQVKHDPRRLELALKKAAAAADEDVLFTQVALLSQATGQTEAGGPHG